MEAYWKQFEGQWVDRAYYLRHLIGTGAFGGVFRADHYIEKRFVRSVALKLILLPRDETEEQIYGKLDELVAATTLHHPHLLSCYHAGSAEVGPAGTKFLYLVMELADGNLKSRLKKELLSTAEAADLVEQVASALIFLHRRFAHRDLKPDNILRVGDEWKLSDYGLIRQLSPDASGRTDRPAGTLPYMPPESFDGTYTSAFDIWSLGVLLVEALTGKRPFGGASEAELIYAIMSGKPQFSLGNSGSFDRMIQGCLTKDHHARWTGDQVLSELKLVRGGPVSSLSEVMRARYLLLGVLLEGMAVSPTIQQVLWKASEGEALDTAGQLMQLALAQPDGVGIRLDSRQWDYVCSQWPDRQALDRIHDAVRLSAHVIQKDPLQFASQIVGRLLSHRENHVIREFTDHMVAGAPRPWLRPLNAALRPPGNPLIRTLEGHSGSVWGVAVSADGRRAVSASHDRTLKVWDLQTGGEPRTLAGHSGEVWSVAVSADGRRAVSASADKTLKVWDLETGREIRTLKGHSGWVVGAAIGRDGRLAVSASWDKTLKVWDLDKGGQPRTLAGHSGVVFGVALSGDGRRAVSASNDKTLKVWDVETGRELWTLKGHAGGVRGVAVSGDGRRAVSASEDNSLKVWDLETGRELQTLEGHSGWVVGVAVSGDGRRAVSASWDETLKVWDLETGREIRTLPGHSGWVVGVTMSEDGRLAVSASSDSTVKVWDMDTDWEPRALGGHSGWVNGVAVSRDGRRAVSGSWDNTLKVWDPETGRELRTMKGHCGTVRGVAVSGDGRRAVSASYDYTLKVWDVETGRELWTLVGHSGWVVGAAVSGDGRMAISASSDGTLKVWDVETGRELWTLKGHTSNVLGVAVSEDGRLAVSASEDNTLKVWDVKAGRELRTLKGHSGAVNAVVLSGDGRRAVSASEDKTMKVWDIGTGQEVQTLRGHLDSILGVALSGDGRQAISASSDGTLRVWDLETGRAGATFTCDAPALCCAFAKSDLIVAGDVDGRVHFLALETGRERRAS